jgi:hypothetical protein
MLPSHILMNQKKFLTEFMHQITRIFILLYIKDRALSDAVFLTECITAVGPCHSCHHGMYTPLLNATVAYAAGPSSGSW